MPKNTKEQIAKRYSKVAELYLKGWFQSDIAKEVKVTQQQVSSDLKVIYRLWRKSSVRDFDIQRERELIKIDKLERTYWEQWDKKTDDPRYLSGVQWCIGKRCELLGLNNIDKSENKAAEIILKFDEGNDEPDNN